MHSPKQKKPSRFGWQYDVSFLLGKRQPCDLYKPIALVTTVTQYHARHKCIIAEQIGQLKSLEYPPQIEMVERSQLETKQRHIWFHERHPNANLSFYHIDATLN